MDKMPLKYKSYEDLKASSAQVDKKLLYQLKRMDVEKCFKHFVDVVRRARSLKHKGNDEEAFLHYQRALELRDLVDEKKDYVFMKGQNGRDFFNICNDMYTAIELLSENLKRRYDELYQLERANFEKKFRETNLSDSTYIFDLYIKPTSLINFIEKNHAKVLVLDYRENKSRYIKCDLRCGEISVVHLEPSTIVLGCLWHALTKTVDISVRPYMEKISQYDLVILLGDLNDITKENGTKTKILYEALTTYNRINCLKNPPLILEDGFRGWEMAYPCYTISSENDQIFEKTFDEKFSVWMEESKKVHRLNIVYPNLSSLFFPSQKSNEFFDDGDGYSNNKVKKQETICVADKLAQRKDERLLEEKASLLLPFTCDSKINNEPSTGSTKKLLPLIDRSKKPVDVSGIFCTENEKLPPAVIDFRDKENMDLPRLNNKRFGFPLVLGGARIASAGGGSSAVVVTSGQPIIHQHPPQPTIQPPSSQPSRPTTPDRSTKKGLPQQSQSTESTALFANVYNASIGKIMDDSSTKRNKIKPGHTGLVNMGNTCFMNATLQALFHTPYFSNLFRGHNVAKFINNKNTLGTRGIISSCFSALIDIAWSGEFSAIRPFFFLEMFATRVNSTLADRQQHDAQEFQIYLLDALHEDTNRVDKRRPFEQNYDGSNLSESAEDFIKQSRHFSSSPVNDIFNLLTVSVLQCKSCLTKSACFEGLNQISVELPHNNLESGRIFRLKECLNTHFSCTTLDTPWDCPRCKSKQTATRTTKIWSYPKILIIHLKRFSFNSGRFVKNEVDVHFEIESFDLTPYTHTKSTFFQNKVEYNLFAVTNHTGTLNSGHYTSNVKNLANENEWLHFDDENCTRIRNISSVVTKHAFLLYYVLGKSGQEDGKNALL